MTFQLEHFRLFKKKYLFTKNIQIIAQSFFYVNINTSFRGVIGFDDDNECFSYGQE